MSALDLSKYKNVDQKTKDLISGYIRNTQITNVNIPALINYICTLFYYVSEKWNKQRTTQNCLISYDELTMESIDENEFTTAFLTQIAESGQHHWKFKIIERPSEDAGNLIIGIVKDIVIDKVIQDQWIGKSKNASYCLDVSFNELNIHDKCNSWEGGYATRCKQGDIIDMYLDLDKLELSFSIGGTHYGKAFDVDSGFGYTAAVSVWPNGTKLTLLSYDCQSIVQHETNGFV